MMEFAPSGAATESAWRLASPAVGARAPGAPAPLARAGPVALCQCSTEESGQFLVTDPLRVGDVALERRAVGHALLGKPRQAGVRLLTGAGAGGEVECAVRGWHDSVNSARPRGCA